MKELSKYLNNFIGYAPTFVQKKIYNKKQHDIASFDSPVDPYKIMWVDPELVTRVTCRPIPPYKPPNNIFGSKADLFGKVMCGDWDIRSDILLRKGYYNHKNSSRDLESVKQFNEMKHGSTNIEETIFYQSIYKHFVDRVDWAETNYYKRLHDDISNNPEAYNSKKKILGHFEDIDKLYYDIHDYGYKTQDEIYPNKTLLEKRSQEIVVDIGRNGDLLFVDGRHRLVIAKCLGLTKIPVVVGIRHEDWMFYRDSLWNNESNFQLTHPDLREWAPLRNLNSSD